MPVRRTARTLRASAIVATVVLVGACSSGAPASSSPGSGAVASGSAPASAASPGASDAGASASGGSAVASSGAAGTLAVTGKDYSFETPGTVAAGITTINFQNTGKEEHQAQLVRINDGKSFQDLTGALQKGDPSAALALVSLAGGPTSVQPGSTGSATSDLKPGNYAFLCFISGADGVPHVAKGMVAPLEVTGTSAGGTLPSGDATVTAKDFTFAVPPSVPTGAHTFSFTNQGPQPHEAGIIKLNSGTTVEQITSILTGPPLPSGAPETPPPWTDAGGIGGVSPGASATFTANLEAGATYAFICFIPDPASGKPHAQLGMIVQIPTK
jgi:plastocyanin